MQVSANPIQSNPKFGNIYLRKLEKNEQKKEPGTEWVYQWYDMTNGVNKPKRAIPHCFQTDIDDDDTPIQAPTNKVHAGEVYENYLNAGDKTAGHLKCDHIIGPFLGGAKFDGKLEGSPIVLTNEHATLFKKAKPEEQRLILNRWLDGLWQLLQPPTLDEVDNIRSLFFEEDNITQLTEELNEMDKQKARLDAKA